jgi:hypothetical protein
MGGGGGRGGQDKHMSQNRTGDPSLLEVLMKNIFKIYSQLLLLGPYLANIRVCPRKYAGVHPVLLCTCRPFQGVGNSLLHSSIFF